LSTVDVAIDEVGQRIYDDATWSALIPVIAALDENGDGLLCWRHGTANSGRDKKCGAEEHIVTLIGDNTRAGRLDKSVVVEPHHGAFSAQRTAPATGEPS
jgi:hypothetical protein